MQARHVIEKGSGCAASPDLSVVLREATIATFFLVANHGGKVTDLEVHD